MRVSNFLCSSLLHFHNLGKWDASLVEAIRSGCTIQPDFINEMDEQDIIAEVEPHMKRLKYEKAHWDDAIYLYREREQRNWSVKNAKIIERIQNASFSDDLIRSTHVHVLDLHADGHIRPHIDSERYCGKVVSGISLLSDCVMRLRHAKKKDDFIIDLWLKRRSLYKLSGPGRHDFTHEILAAADSHFDGKTVERGRRISIICRDVPCGNAGDPNQFVHQSGRIKLES